MLVKVHLDFETENRLDIKAVGAKLYAEHPSNRIMSLAFAVGEGQVRHIRNVYAGVDPELYALAANSNVLFYAHNAFFEQCQWEEEMVPLGYPSIPIERWRCTMAKALAHGLPAKLEQATEVMNCVNKKNAAGHKVMLKLCKPRRNGEFWTYDEIPDQYEIMYQYNVEDVLAERELDGKLRDLSPIEQRIWEIDQKINHAGVNIDVMAVTRAAEVAEEYSESLVERFRAITGFNPTQRPSMRVWLNASGVAVGDTKASTLRAALPSVQSPVVAEAISLFIESNRASVAKYSALIVRSKNGLLREMYRYGGTHTLRWTSMGVQIHNLPRPDKNISSFACAEAIKTLPYSVFTLLYSDVPRALSVMLRSVFVAPEDSTLFIADYAQIEDRKTAWFAGQEETLDLFRRGDDLYCVQATATYGYPVTKGMVERQVGKVQRLAFGYGGGINAGATFAVGYGVDLEALYEIIVGTATVDEIGKAQWSYQNYLNRNAGDPDFEPISERAGLVADILKQRFRKSNPRIVAYWYELQDAVIRAIQTGEPQQCGKVTWFTHDRWLYCQLPSGRMMAYCDPKLLFDGNKITISYMGVHPIKKTWVRLYTWGGKLLENIVQASSRDVMAWAMIRLENHGYTAGKYLCMHTHDELIARVPKFEVKFKTKSLDQFITLMKKVPTWADGCPIDAEGTENDRYGKAA